MKPLSSPSANNAISKNISPKSETVVEVPIETPVTTKKKKVTWKNDSQLVEIRIFARDEPEEELKEEEAKVIVMFSLFSFFPLFLNFRDYLSSAKVHAFS